METMDLQVKGMTCTGCEQRIARVLERIDGVRRVEADHVRGLVRVRVGPAFNDRQMLAERIEELGYALLEAGGDPA